MCPMDITNSIITASSTLLAVGITLYFTNRREKNNFLQDLKLKEYIELETFYVSLLSSIEMAIRYTERGENYKDLLVKTTRTCFRKNQLTLQKPT